MVFRQCGKNVSNHLIPGSSSVNLSCARNSGINFKNNACTRILDYYWFYASNNCYYNPNILKSVPSAVVQNGYDVEIHRVVTDDGYILELFRIPPKGTDQTKARQPVFLQHGITASSSSFVATGNTSSASLFHEMGYDVWLGNSRGSPNSKEHVTLKSSQKEFWDFTLDSLALYDLRSSLGFVANHTRQKIIYLGHSMGTTTVFMYCSTFPSECEGIVQGIIAFSPIVYLNPARKFQPLIKKDRQIYFVVTTLLRINVVAPNDTPLRYVINLICRIAPYPCKLFIDFSFGDSEQTPEYLLVFYSDFPKAVTTKLLLQYGQIYNSQEFKKFDHGVKGNMKTYGQKRPPLYDLGKVKLPTFMFYGPRDPLITGKGVKRLLRELGSTRKILKLTSASNETLNFNHIDFNFSKLFYTFFQQEMVPLLENEFTAKSITNN